MAIIGIDLGTAGAFNRKMGRRENIRLPDQLSIQQPQENHHAE
jgi:hypothetical protein